MQNFKELKVWEKAHALVLRVYQLTKTFPREEQYGLVSQMRRAAVCVPTNIAEGRSRSSDKEFARFLDIAFGSAAELEYFILLAKDLEMIDSASYNQLNTELEEVKKMVFSFAKKLKETN